MLLVDRAIGAEGPNAHALPLFSRVDPQPLGLLLHMGKGIFMLLQGENRDAPLFCLKHYKTRCTPVKRDRTKNPRHGQHPEQDQNEIGTRYELA